MRLSIKPDAIGKQPEKLSGMWYSIDVTVNELVQINYLNGQAIAHGLFDTSELGTDESTNKTNTHWQGSQVVVIDLDEGELLHNTFLNSFCLCYYPSSSYTPDHPKYHLFFELDKVVTDEEIYKAVARYVADSCLTKPDYSTSRISQAVFGTVFTKWEHEKSIDDVWINPNPSKVSVQNILALIKTENGVDDVSSERSSKLDGVPVDKRTNLALSAVEYAFRNWGYREYNEWLGLTIASYACSSDLAVRDAILEHPDIEWDKNGKKSFIRWWSSFTLKDEGYTAATLFYYARKNGWLQYTDNDHYSYESFNELEVGDFLKSLNPVPPRMLIVSNTGTGKTRGAIETYKRLKIVKKAVFFAPSIKLCIALSHTLTSMGVDNTLYIDGNQTKTTETLADAKVLVTTLQTFATKLMSKGVKISDYEFVVIDESDELISSFARAEIGYAIGQSSHVRRQQSWWGFYTLKALLEEAKWVIMLDGTATAISVDFGNMFSPEPFKVYKNTASRIKAPVKIVPTVNMARESAVRAVLRGEKVVIATDTRREARLMYEYLSTLVDSIILITGDTNLETKVKQFFEDVEQGAKDYQVVIYNSAMGSGVSIVDTVPDLVVQIATHVSPRKNLQILNRYRRQKQVVCFVPVGDRLFYESVTERLTRLKRNIATEGALIGVEPNQRDFIAQSITRVAEQSITDDLQQVQATRDFYMRLLRDDNRVVTVAQVSQNVEFKEAFKLAYDLLDQHNADIMHTWRSVDPISRENLPGTTLSMDDLARGLLHHRIKTVVPNYETLEENDYEIAKLVQTYGKYVRVVERWLTPNKTVDKAVIDLLNKEQADITVKLYLARMELLCLVEKLFKDTEAIVNLSDNKLYTEFIRDVELRTDIFNTLVPSRSHYHILASKKSGIDLALTLARYILKGLGLNVKRKNGKRTADGSRERVAVIEGTDGILKLLAWRGHNLAKLVFDSSLFYGTLERTKEVSLVLKDMPEPLKQEIVYKMQALYFSFNDALDTTGYNYV